MHKPSEEIVSIIKVFGENMQIGAYCIYKPDEGYRYHYTGAMTTDAPEKHREENDVQKLPR
jgi:hypothetical protein